MRAIVGVALLGACSFTGPGNPAGDGDGDGPDGGSADAAPLPQGRCGTPGMFVDGFDQKAPYWNELGTSSTLSGGRLVVAPSRSFFDGFESRWVVDLIDAQTAVEVTRHPAPGETIALTYALLEDNNNYMRFGVTDTEITGEVVVSGVADGATAPLDRAAHRHLRMREASGQVFFETSPDGATWSVLHQTTTPAFAGRANVLLGGEQVGGTAGTIEFDNFNDGVNPAIPCASTTMSDGFDDSMVGGQWLETEIGRCQGINETGSVIQFSQSGGSSPTRCSIQSRALYDLSQSAAGVFITAIFSFSGDWHTFLEVRSMSGGSVMLRFINDQMCADGGDGVSGFDTCIDYNVHEYWRLRGDAGDLVAEVSTDGATWDQVIAAPAPFDLEWVSVSIGTASSDISGSIGLSVSDYNLPPAI